MFQKIIDQSIQNKLIVFLGVTALLIGGFFAIKTLPLDAVPDITNNQVQVVTVSPTLAPQEVEQFITYPVEIAMANIPNVSEIRSISRYGLSVVTIVFEESVPVMRARQFVKEQIDIARNEIPAYLGSPSLMPITTGLGEIYQYVLQVDPNFADHYSLTELRTIQDWIVKRQLAGIEGIIEISSFGGYVKQYEVALDPQALIEKNVTVQEVLNALELNNQNSGGSYIEDGPNAYYIRSYGMVQNASDIESIVVKNHTHSPITIKQIGAVRIGNPKRYGAMTMDGNGETVGGITLMFKGASSSAAIANVHQRISEIQSALPAGVHIYPYLDRSVLVGKTINTVTKNLIEGGLIVIFVLVLLLGNLRAGLIVASVIPLSMVFALILMNVFGVSANLMSLGAIDFGIVVDGAVIIIEAVLHYIYTYHIGEKLSKPAMNKLIGEQSGKIYKSAAFGVLIILLVFLPIMTLTGVEGKMFRPMALTVSFALLGAMILSITYVPVMASIFLKRTIKTHKTFADKLMNSIRSAYLPTLSNALQKPILIIGISLALFLGAIVQYSRMGSEFLPTLEEGDLAMQLSIQPGSSLNESIHTSTQAEEILMSQFPEVKHVISKIGTAEVPTDPMAIEEADVMILLKEKDEWVSASTREELVEKMKAALAVIPGASMEFTQPIQLRFNELMTGAKTDIVVKIYGENTSKLKQLADEAAVLIQDIQGAGDVKVEQTEGLQQLVVEFNREKLAYYGISIDAVNTTIRTAYAGESAGLVFENERKFDLVARLQPNSREQLNLDQLFMKAANGEIIPISEVAQFTSTEGPMQISRENAKRKINIGVNVRNRDVASLVADIETALNTSLKLPPGYTITYGGQFENLQNALNRLQIAVPAALFMILLLLYMAFGSVKYAVMIFSAVPLSAIGGIVALNLRSMPFSISAGIGFIALFGVAVLNGIVMISYFNQLQQEGKFEHLKDLIQQGAAARIRPVIMTAAVAALGFLPMALSNSNGAEIQKPLATVVIGGLISSTLLTLIVLPVIYYLFERKTFNASKLTVVALVLASLGSTQNLQAQTPIDSLLERSYQSFVTHENNSLQQQSEMLKKQSAFLVGTTDFQYQYGQINDAAQDYQFQVLQGIDNPLYYAKAVQRAKSAVELLQINDSLQKAQYFLNARKAYYSWWNTAQQLKKTEQYLVSYSELEKTLQTSVDAGEQSAVTLNLIQTGKLKLQQQLAQLQLAVNQQQYLFSIWVPTELPLDFTEYEALPIQNSGLTNLHKTLFNKQLEVKSKEIALAKSAYFPSFQAGYFQQRIGSLNPLNGFIVGVSMPLWPTKTKSATKIAQLEFQQLENSTQYELSVLEKQLIERVNSVHQLQATIAQTKAYLNVNSTLKENAYQLLIQGENSVLEYTLLLENVLNTELTYLELLHQQNLATLDIYYLNNL